jgi:hypothetical protein
MRSSSSFSSVCGFARAALPVFALAAGCGTSASTSSPAPSVPDAGPDASPGNVIAFDLSADVAPSEETHVCQLVRMPTAPAGDTEIFVSGGDYTTTPGTHHFLLFRTAPIDPPLPIGQPLDCFEGQGVMRFERGFVTGGQQRGESADFPAGAALAFKGGDVLLFQGHFLNAGAAPVTAKIHVELRTTPASAVQHRVGTFRFYDPYIFVPGRGAGTARMRCPVKHDVTIVSAGSHMHRRGVGYRASLDLPGAAPAAAPFFTTTDWEHPPYFHGPLAAPAGSFIRFACDYASTDPADVVQGLSAETNEMCMFSAFYYPEGAADEDECYDGDEHGGGDRNCAQTLSCIQTCPRSEAPVFGDGKADVGPCFQKCIVDSCPNVTGKLIPELLCAQAKCPSECATYGAACSKCVLDNCPNELDTCQALACGN